MATRRGETEMTRRQQGFQKSQLYLSGHFPVSPRWHSEKIILLSLSSRFDINVPYRKTCNTSLTAKINSLHACFNPSFLKFYTCIHSHALVEPGALGVYSFQMYGLFSLILYCS